MTGRIENRTIKLRKPLTDSAEKALLSELRMLEGVSAAEASTQGIEIKYDFPLLCFAQIWILLNRHLEKDNLSQVQRWRLSLIAYMEENEQEHLLKPSHWHLFVRDIHVHCHALRQTAREKKPKQLWRKHKKTSATQ